MTRKREREREREDGDNEWDVLDVRGESSMMMRNAIVAVTTTEAEAW